MCERVIYENLFMPICCPNRHRFQKLCNEVADDCPGAFEFIPDWFVTSKMLEKIMMLYSLMMIYSFWMKTLIKSHFVLIKCAFLL